MYLNWGTSILAVTLLILGTAMTSFLFNKKRRIVPSTLAWWLICGMSLGAVTAIVSLTAIPMEMEFTIRATLQKYSNRSEAARRIAYEGAPLWGALAGATIASIVFGLRSRSCEVHHNRESTPLN
jgi:hypothetical protein